MGKPSTIWVVLGSYFILCNFFFYSICSVTSRRKKGKNINR